MEGLVTFAIILTAVTLISWGVYFDYVTSLDIEKWCPFRNERKVIIYTERMNKTLVFCCIITPSTILQWILIASIYG